MSKERVGLYPGTFDPITNGHMDIILRGLRIVDTLIVGVAVNAGKGPLFPIEDRMAMVREEVDSATDAETAKRVVVRTFDGLLIDYAKRNGVTAIVRGLRAVSDFEYEFQMASMNRKLDPSIEIAFLMASDKYHFISSRFVKEIGALGGDISHFVSEGVAKRLLARYAQGEKVLSGAASKAY
ncbi:MAG TPA: pantetheine-phosphate adenylyltransferase [Kaistia sp.]|nr:pantetheine-phosphate adenylyltransferase [Kaistia sp.]